MVYRLRLDSGTMDRMLGTPITEALLSGKILAGRRFGWSQKAEALNFPVGPPL